jgi:hypothetical protein
MINLSPTAPKVITSLPTGRAYDGPGLIIKDTSMAFRPYENLIDGELDNRVPGKVTGWIRFFRQGKKPLKVSLDFKGDFHEDIRGKAIRLSNPKPSDRNEELGREGTYMEGISVNQCGEVGDITAGLPLGPWTPALAQKLLAQRELKWDEDGVSEAEREELRKYFAAAVRKHIDAGDLCYPYVAYPYIEWYSESNGRVVLELDSSQVEILDAAASIKEKTPAELVQDERRRSEAMGTFLAGMTAALSKENRKKGGDGNVFGVVIR